MLIRMRALLLAALVLLALAHAAGAEPVGTFTRVEGGVDILRRSDIVVLPVKAGDPVSLGDAIRTRRNGKAEIRFQDETMIQLAPETRITIDQYTYRGPGQRENGLLSLFRGKMRAIVSKARAVMAQLAGTASSFSVKTPTAIAGVKGTQLIVFYNRGVTGAVFLDGEGFLYNPGRPERIVPVKGGQASFVMGRDDPALDAQPVPESFVAPYLRDFPGSGPAAEGISGPSSMHLAPGAGGERTMEAPGGAKPGMEARMLTTDSIVEQNTSYETLANSVVTDGYLFSVAAPPPPPALVLVNPDALPVEPPGGVATLVPVTDANPQLLPTPVTVTVTIP